MSRTVRLQVKFDDTFSEGDIDIILSAGELAIANRMREIRQLKSIWKDKLLNSETVEELLK